MPKAIDVAYVVYQVTDLDRMESFMQDFGLVTAEKRSEALFMRGACPAPFIHMTVKGDENRFVGGAMQMASKADLEALAALPGSSTVEPITDLPGGGWRVRMHTPDGVPLDGVWGRRPSEALPLRAPHAFNAGTVKTRVNYSLRPKREPGLVLRIGHFGLRCSSHDETLQWFRDRFGVLDSDYLCVPDNVDRVIGTFLRFNQGETSVDHHFMLITQSRNLDDTGVHHCSFEMQDIDALMGAHDHLLECGYQLECGVGRHLVGSQIFDYWHDSFGFRVEHYTDGDVSNVHYQPVRYAVAADETTQWGMQPPKTFFD